MRLMYLIVALLCFEIANAQTYWGEITYPIYGSVMQGTSTSNSVDVCFQVRNQSSVDWRITLIAFDFVSANNYSLSYPSSYYNKALTDPSLQFAISNVSGNTSYSMVKGKLNGLPKKQYLLYLHVGNFSLFSLNFTDRIAFGVGDVYFIAGQSNASGYNISAKSVWNDPNNITNRRGLHDFSSLDDSTVPIKLAGTNTGSLFTRSLNFNGRFDFWASIYDGGAVGEPDSPERLNHTNIGKKYNELSPENGNWFGLPYGGKYEQLRHGTDKLNDPVHIFPNGQASWYWSSLGQKIGSEKGVPTLFFNIAMPGTSLIKDWTAQKNSFLN